MIQINLLPEELKVKTQKTSAPVDADKFLNFLPAVLAVVVAVHAVLFFIQLGGFARIGGLNRRMKVLEPQRRQLESQRLAASEPTKVAIENFLAQNIAWSFKLNKLSQHVPAGVWFNDVSVTPLSTVIKGSVVSLEGNEMGSINTFMSNLRNDAEFMKGFGQPELGALGTKLMGTYSVTDFTVTLPAAGSGSAPHATGRRKP